MARRSAPIDPATRAHALARAEAIGDMAAAAEVGVALPTLRSWRHRAAQAAADSGRPIAAAGRGSDQLRVEAQRAREAEARAVAKCDRLLAAGKASQAKAASSIAADAGARSLALERAAREEEQHAARMCAEALKLSAKDVGMLRQFSRLFVRSLGLGWAEAHERLFWASARAIEAAIERGDRSEHGRLIVSPPEPETRETSEAIDRLLRTGYRDEFLREFGIPEPEQVVRSADEFEREIQEEFDRLMHGRSAEIPSQASIRSMPGSKTESGVSSQKEV